MRDNIIVSYFTFNSKATNAITIALLLEIKPLKLLNSIILFSHHHGCNTVLSNPRNVETFKWFSKNIQTVCFDIFPQVAVHGTNFLKVII